MIFNRFRSKVDPTAFNPGLEWHPQPHLQPPQAQSHHRPLPHHTHLIHPAQGGRIHQVLQPGPPFPAQQLRTFRPPQAYSSPEYRIYDFNKRLLMRTEDCDNLWWDQFITEFFEEDATLTVTFSLEDGPKRFSIGRTLIPRYFRTIFDGGVNELYFVLKQTKESFHTTTITLDSELCTMVTCFGKPMYIKICTEGQLVLEFTFDELMRIKSWQFNIKSFRELIPRSVVAMPSDPGYLEQLTKNITRCGLTSDTMNFLKLCVLLEPMQELMSRHKTTSFSPHECLRTILHQKWSRVCPDTRPATKPRRKRKSNMANNTNSKDNTNHCSTPASNAKKRSPAPPLNSSCSYPGSSVGNNLPGDVMIVGEPSLMGGDLDEEDERYITRLENTQYDSAATMNIPSHLHPPYQHLPQQQQQQQPFQTDNKSMIIKQNDNNNNTNNSNSRLLPSPFQQQPFVLNHMKREAGQPPPSSPNSCSQLPSMFNSSPSSSTSSTSSSTNQAPSVTGNLMQNNTNHTNHLVASNSNSNSSTCSNNSSNGNTATNTKTATNYKQNLLLPPSGTQKTSLAPVSGQGTNLNSPPTPQSSTATANNYQISPSINASINNTPLSSTTATPNSWNGTSSSTSNVNVVIAEKKLEPHTPPAQVQPPPPSTPQTISTVS